LRGQGVRAAQRSGSPTTTSRGSVPFGVSARAIVVPVCLSGTFRSRGFSPPQRFHPARASWLCFTPHPPLGFRSSEPFPFGQPRRLSASRALLPFRPAPTASSDLVAAVAPVLAGSVSSRACRFRLPSLPRAPRAALGVLPPASHRSGAGRGRGRWRPVGLVRGALGWRDRVRSAFSEPSRTGWSRRLQSLAPTERPFPSTGRQAGVRADALLTFLPSGVLPFGRWACALPSCACSARSPFRPKVDWRLASRHSRVSIQPNLGAALATGSDPHGVSDLIRSPLQPSGASGCPAVSFARGVRVNTTRSGCRGVTLCAALGSALAEASDLTSGD